MAATTPAKPASLATSGGTNPQHNPGSGQKCGSALNYDPPVNTDNCSIQPADFRIQGCIAGVRC
jgi:hypothetical protein